MKLAELQRQLQAAIWDEKLKVPSFLAGTGERRLAVYRNAYRLRLVEALAADYPKLCRWLGEDRFAKLALGYVAAYPSRERSLRWVGKHLPQFLRSTCPWQARPELYEMALFEWNLGLAFDCGDAQPMSPEHLARVPIERWPAIQFKLHPSVCLLSLAYPIPQLWKALEADGPAPLCLRLQDPIAWLIWRKEFKVFFRSLAEPERLALEKVQAGCAFAEVCEGLAGWDLKPDVARYAAGLLKQWLEDGLLAVVE